MKKIYVFAVGLMISPFISFGQQELVTNGSFELGEQGWDFTLGPNSWADAGDCIADDGLNYLWFGDYAEVTGINDMVDGVSQNITLPMNLASATYSFSWSGTSDEQDNVFEYDFLYASLYDVTANVAISYDSISNAYLDTSLTVEMCDVWDGIIAINLGPQYAGHTIEIGFLATTDDSNPTIFRVDNVSMMVTTTAGITENVVSSLVVGPNPASYAITVKNLSTSEMDVVILNSEGKEMSKTLLSQGENEINISALSSGIYFIKEMNGLVTKLIKQ